MVATSSLLVLMAGNKTRCLTSKKSRRKRSRSARKEANMSSLMTNRIKRSRLMKRKFSILARQRWTSLSNEPGKF